MCVYHYRSLCFSPTYTIGPVSAAAIGWDALNAYRLCLCLVIMFQTGCASCYHLGVASFKAQLLCLSVNHVILESISCRPYTNLPQNLKSISIIPVSYFSCVMAVFAMGCLLFIGSTQEYGG